METDNKCALTLIKLVYDNFSFTRLGFKNNNKPNLKIKIGIGKDDKNSPDLDIVSLIAKIEKKAEYEISIQLSGYFKASENEYVSQKDLLEKNAVAILMPYLRSQVFLITAQPEVDCIVMPPFNINNMARIKENEEL